jgi:hypothetical protein
LPCVEIFADRKWKASTNESVAIWPDWRNAVPADFRQPFQYARRGDIKCLANLDPKYSCLANRIKHG